MEKNARRYYAPHDTVAQKDKRKAWESPSMPTPNNRPQKLDRAVKEQYRVLEERAARFAIIHA